MPTIIILIQIYLVLLSMLNSVESVEQGTSFPGNSTRVIVQLSRPASGDLLAQQREGVSAGILEADAVQQRSDFIASLKTNGLSGRVVYSYSRLFNGLSLDLDDASDLNTLNTLPGVLQVFPARRYTLNPLGWGQTQSLHTESETETDTDFYKQTAHIMTGVDIVHRDYPKITGNGVKVGIIGSGIDYLHPALSIPGQKCNTFKGTECRVQFGTDFVGDNYGVNGNFVPIPDGDPMDTCNGYGTAVAGIIGGNDDKIKGVAQGVVFGSYRVIGCSGATSDDLILAGLDAADNDGMQVIHLSTSGGYLDNSNPIAQVVDKLAQSGVIIISMAGDGYAVKEGYGTVVAESVAKMGIGTTSYYNSQRCGIFLTVTGVPGLDSVSFAVAEGIARFIEATPFNVIVSPQQTSASGDGCTAFNADTFKNGVALLFYSEKCGFSDMVSNAVNTGGAKGVLIYGSEPVFFVGDLDPKKANFPTVFLEEADGVELSKASGSVTVTFDYTITCRPVKNAGRPTAVSAMGLDLNLLMKPDIGGPGGFIMSSVPNGKYNEWFGTGIAAAYMAGVAALEVGQSAGKTTFMAFQRRLHITGKPTLSSVDDRRALTVAKIGAGLVDVPKFLFSTVDIEPSKLELGDGVATKKHTIKVTNTGDKPLTYTISHLASESFKAAGGVPQQLLEKDPSNADLAFSIASITIEPKQSIPFEVTITPGTSHQHVIQSGFIKLENTVDQNGSLTIPYALMTGEYSKFPVIGTEFPSGLYPANIVDDSSIPPFGNTGLPTFNLETKATSPAFAFELVFPVRRMDVVLETANTNSSVGLLYTCTYCQPFGPTAFNLQATIFDLQDLSQEINIPNGSYKIVVQAVLPSPLKPPSDDKAALVTILQSIPFNVDDGSTPISTPPLSTAPINTTPISTVYTMPGTITVSTAPTPFITLSPYL